MIFDLSFQLIDINDVHKINNIVIFHKHNYIRENEFATFKLNNNFFIKIIDYLFQMTIDFDTKNFK